LTLLLQACCHVKPTNGFTSSPAPSHLWPGQKRIRPWAASNNNNNNINGDNTNGEKSKGSGKLVYDPSVMVEEEGRDYIFVNPSALYSEDPSDQRYSSADWWDNMKSLKRSTILRAIKSPMITVMVFSAIVSIVHLIFKSFYVTRGWANAMCMSSKPHSFLVSALGLLLVFRTNSAYQRFAEGRKIWENILSISRNISRLSSLYEDDLGGERKHRIFRLLGAFPYLLHHHIQPQCLSKKEYDKIKGTVFAMQLNECAVERKHNPKGSHRGAAYKQQNKNNGRFGALRRVFRGYSSESSTNNNNDDFDECEICTVDRRALPWCLLPPSALVKCADSFNRPLWICDRLSQEVTNVKYSDNYTSRERLAFLSQIDKLSKCIGGCERIHQTAV